MRIVVAAAVLAVSVALAITFAWFVPLATDGGWYSYPGYALSKGRDPAENLLPLHAVGAGPEGVRAVFGYELRSFLIVPFHAGWFTIAGTSLLSLKVFGALQWMTLAALVTLGVWRVTGSRWAACVAGLATLSDSWVISQSLGDLRPDVPNAIAAVVCVVALVSYQKTGRWPWLAAAIASASALTLLHLTSVLALTFLSALAIALVVMPGEKAPRRLALVLIPVCAGLAFLFRQPIMDILVPTGLALQDEMPHREDLWARWQAIVSGGVSEKFRFETERWLDYFFVANFTQLLFIVVGLAGLGAAWRQAGAPVARAMLLAGMVSLPVILAIDPSPTRGHLVPLASLAYVAAGIGLALILQSPLARPAVTALIVIGIMTVVLRGALAANVAQSHGRHGVSNHELVAFMAGVLEPDADHVVIAPTFLWPYIDPSGSVVLIEPGSRLWHVEDHRWPLVNKVIVDRDFHNRGWTAFAARMERCRSFVRESSVGSRSGFFLDTYRVVAKPCEVAD